jgi:putative ABC transport system ATP-binding protein
MEREHLVDLETIEGLQKRVDELETIVELKRRIAELESQLGVAAPAGRDESIVVTENLTKIYGGGPVKVTALSGVNLRVRRGEFVAVQGPSGSGKTTLLNMLGALDRPTRGRVFIDGVDTTRIREGRLYRIRREKIGFIFQTYYLVPTINALHNVLMPVMPIRRGHNDAKARAEELMETVGLKDRMRHRPGELSGGEQQRVAIARALVLDPSVILADEPTGNLDSKTGAEIIELMQRLNREQGKTFIIVTHDRRIAESAQRVFYLRDGSLSATPIEEY